MLGGMMDPEMMRLAQEQMSKIPPDELMRMQQQMMNNPDLIRMATEGMKNLRSEDIKFAAEQMKRLRPEDMAEMSSRMANASPEEIAAMRMQAEAQQNYEYQGALTLKNQGNRLHGDGKYKEAAEKYQRAKENLSGMRTAEAVSLRLACSLNLMSCYLKTQQYDNTVAEGTEVLASDPNNLKALYRRGQAYKELGKLRLAFKDLTIASEVAPDDETVKEVLGHLRGEVELEPEESDEEESSTRARNGPIIEEISDKEPERLTAADDHAGQRHHQTPQQSAFMDQAQATSGPSGVSQEAISCLKENPEMVRNMYTIMSSLNPEQIASMSGGQMNPDMARLASDMVKRMSPEDMQKMVDMMATFQPQGRSQGSAPTVQASTRETSRLNTLSASPSSQREEPGMVPAQGSGSQGFGLPSMPNFGQEMQDQMKQRMKDPAMKQMMAAMIQNMTPETMASMSEQFGFKMSPEEAQKAQTAMSNLSPDDIEKLMKWADRVQVTVSYAKKVKNFLLGRPGLILALVILLIAIVLHWLGFIGS